MDYYKNGEEKFGVISSRLYSFGSSRSMQKFYCFISKDIKKEKPKSILDIGAGPGDLAIKLSEIKNTKVFCIDPSVSMKKIAENKFAKRKIKNIEYKLGSSRYIPIKEKFDVIVTTISFHHWKEKESSIRYILKRLNEKGKFIIYEFCYDKLNAIQKMSIGKHSLSIKQAKSYKFRGYKKEIEITNKIIKVSFTKDS
jgi:ubiquinone/menaquinone biosynthesis C-methylase UbiE